MATTPWTAAPASCTAAVRAFIALVALLLTQPSGEPASLFDRPVPLPAGPGLGPGRPPLQRQRPALALWACFRIVSSVAFGVIRLPS